MTTEQIEQIMEELHNVQNDVSQMAEYDEVRDEWYFQEQPIYIVEKLQDVYQKLHMIKWEQEMSNHSKG